MCSLCPATRYSFGLSVATLCNLTPISRVLIGFHATFGLCYSIQNDTILFPILCPRFPILFLNSFLPLCSEKHSCSPLYVDKVESNLLVVFSVHMPSSLCRRMIRLQYSFKVDSKRCFCITWVDHIFRLQIYCNTAATSQQVFVNIQYFHNPENQYCWSVL